jgi:hypothetical protein
LAVTSLESLGSVLSWDIFVQGGYENQPPGLSLISYACRTLAPHRIAMSIQIGCIQFLSFSLKNQVCSQFQFIYYHILLRNKEKNCATFLFSRLSFTIPLNLKNDRFVLQFFILEQLDKMDLHA